MAKSPKTKIKLLKKKSVKRPPARPRESEQCLHMKCQQWLVRSGWWDRLLIFHVPNERRGGIGTIMHFKRLGVRKGVADYLVFGGLRDAAIELKDEDGEQDAEQEKFQRQWEASGRLYFIVRTLESFQGTVLGLAPLWR